LNKILNWIETDDRLELVSRWTLGVIFIYASLHKIADPASFARIVYEYALFPNITINLIAIVLPYIECVVGCALITGIYPKSAAIIANLLMVQFIVIITINLIRGHEFDCGCFAAPSENPEPAWVTLIRDLALLVPGLIVSRFRRVRKFCLFPTQRHFSGTLHNAAPSIHRP
jgi:hypothetical protein